MAPCIPKSGWHRAFRRAFRKSGWHRAFRKEWMAPCIRAFRGWHRAFRVERVDGTVPSRRVSEATIHAVSSHYQVKVNYGFQH